MKTLSKVKFSRDFFQNEIANGNTHFRIDNFNRKIRIAKRDCDFCMDKKTANECKAQLESFRKKSLYGEDYYFFKSKQHEKNFIKNNFSSTHKKECQKLFWQMAFYERKKARQKAKKLQVFSKLFE